MPTVTIVCLGSAALLFVRQAGAMQDRWLILGLVWLAAVSTLVGNKTVSIFLAAAIVSMTIVIFRGNSRRLAAAIGIAAAILLIAYIVRGTEYVRIVLGTLLLTLLAAMIMRVLVRFLQPVWMGMPSGVGLMGMAVGVLVIIGFTQNFRQGFDFPRWPKDEDWYAAQAWARENTPPETMFYSPDRFAFSTMSRRPVWWSANQGAAVMWQPAFFEQWNARRLRAEAAVSMADLVELAKEENIRYLVVERQRIEKEKADGIAPGYCNNSYCIVKMGGS